jgi:N4-gp56 family major capsid protein
MANQTTSNLTNSIRAQYVAQYFEAATKSRVYDQLASPVGLDMTNLAKGSSVVVPFLSQLPPSTQTIPETGDVVTSQFVDATATVTPTSRANAILYSQVLEDRVFTDFTAKAYAAVGENMMLSVDLMAKTAALTGYLTRSPTARASLQATTTTHRITKAAFASAQMVLMSMKVPMFQTPQGGRWMAIMHPFVFNDLFSDAIILAVGEYQNGALIMNYELGEINNFKLIVTPWAKMFWGAGAVNASSISTTSTTDNSPLDKVINVAANTNIAAGMRMMIGTVETGNTHYDTNESVVVASVATNAITIIGEGENGGLRYPHASGSAVKNASTAAPVAFGGMESLAKVYDPAMGEYGQIVGPKPQGLVDQYTSLGWKWGGGYGIISQNRVLRSEFSVSLDN